MSDDLVFPTFTLPYGARPWKAASKDGVRPVLYHGWLHKREDGWWLLTSDSFIACAVKVETTGEPVEGQVPRSILKLMARSNRLATQLPDGGWRVVYNGEWTYRPTQDRPAKFADLEEIGMWDPPAEAVTTKIGLDPKLTSRLREAMGLLEVGVCLRFTAKGAKGDPTLSPIQVTPTSDPGDRRGLQMPVRLS